MTHQIVNGEVVTMTSEEIEQQLKEQKAAFDRLSSYRWRIDRRASYPTVGDQLDAILKQFNYLQMSKQIDCISELDTIITRWLKVKRDIPNPTDAE